MWVAKDKNNIISSGLHLFVEKPIRNKVVEGYWGTKGATECMEIDSSLFPNLKWEDEPIEVKLVPKMMNAVQEKLAESVDYYFDYVSHVQDIHPYSKEQEQNYYNDMCWRWQDWDAIKYDHPSTWDLNFDDYVVN